MLCGSGTTGHHGDVERRDEVVLECLGRYILKARGDTISFLYHFLGAEAAQEYMRRHLLLD